ncbi:MAG: ElyC/SanA/YdcF family protein [Gaiellaceae bacterium]
MTRLVAVLGYSDGTTTRLHPVCDRRLRRAAAVAGADDVVLFSGWRRGTAVAPEADLMASQWSTPTRARLVDREARTTLGNAVAVARAARRLGVDEVVVVTSRWHAKRAGILVRSALAGSGTRMRVVAADEPSPPAHRLREAAAWLAVPVLAAVAARTR